MMSGLDGPPPPRMTLTPLDSNWVEAVGEGAVSRPLAVTSGASRFRGAGRTSTLATANGSPVTGTSCLRRITRVAAIARTVAANPPVPVAASPVCWIPASMLYRRNIFVKI